MIQSHHSVTVNLNQEGALGMDMCCAHLDVTLKCQTHRQILRIQLLGRDLSINIPCC